MKRLKEAILLAGGIRSAMPRVRQLGLSDVELNVYLEIDEAVAELMSRRAKKRVAVNRLDERSIAAIDQGLDAGLHFVQIAVNAKTTRTTVWRHAKRRAQQN